MDNDDHKRDHLREAAEQSARDQGFEDIGNDMVLVPHSEIDRILVYTLKMRAESIREEGDNVLADDMDILAGRLAEHAQIPDDTIVAKPVTNTLTHIGPERRLRPRLVHPTPPSDDDL